MQAPNLHQNVIQQLRPCPATLTQELRCCQNEPKRQHKLCYLEMSMHQWQSLEHHCAPDIYQYRFHVSKDS